MWNSPIFFSINHLYHGVIDIFYAVFVWRTLLFLLNSPWKRHVKWIAPMAVGAIIDIIYGTIVNLHFFFRIGRREIIYPLEYMMSDISSLVFLCSVILLYRTMREIPDAAPTQTPPAAPSGVWPPPPRMP